MCPFIAHVIFIDMSSNKIDELKFQSTVNKYNMKLLNLANNSLEMITPSTFAPLYRLKYLNLAHNPLVVMH